MRSTFKVLFYVKKGSEKPNGNLPLMCRITVDGEIKQFSCKMDVPLRLWDVKNNRASGKSVEAQKINIAIDKIRVEVNRRYQELMQTDGYVTATKLKDAYLGIGVKQETLLKLFEQHNSEFAKKVGQIREHHLAHAHGHECEEDYCIFFISLYRASPFAVSRYFCLG